MRQMCQIKCWTGNNRLLVEVKLSIMWIVTYVDFDSVSGKRVDDSS